MKAKEVKRRLEADGWFRIAGKRTGHLQFKHPTKPGKVTLPNHPGDLKLWVLESIEEQSGVKMR